MSDLARELEKLVGTQVHCAPARGGRMRLVVRAGQVRLSVPRGLADAEARSFVERLLPWLRKHLCTDVNQEQRADSAFQLADGGSVPIFGEVRRIALSADGAPHHLNAETLTLLARPGAKQLICAQKQLLNALHASLQAEVYSQVRHYSEVLQVSPRKITLKAMQSRWGSLGPDNAMSLNLALVFAPLPCTAYVVAHELCHMLERNHSPRFWMHVTRAYPTWQREHRWLRQHYGYLMELKRRLLS